MKTLYNKFLNLLAYLGFIKPCIHKIHVSHYDFIKLNDHVWLIVDK